MLGKLIKHEWKSTGKVCGFLLLGVILMTLLGCLSFATPLWNGLFSADTGVAVSAGFMGIMLFVFYILAIVGVIYGILIYLGVHFYKTMYSDEGYLTHTLPVTAHQLLISKTLVAGLWYLIVTAVMLISILALVLTGIGRAMAADGVNLLAGTAGNWKEILYEMENALGISLAGELLLYLLQIILGAFGSALMLFGASTIGQLSAKHKVLMSVLTYFGLLMAVQFISSVVMIPLTFRTTQKIAETASVTLQMTTMPVFVTTMILNTLIGAAMYFVSYLIITRKLNLD